MKNNQLLDDMESLLAESEAKIKTLGAMVSKVHSLGSAITEDEFRKAERIKKEVVALTQSWWEKYNAYYNSGD